MVAPTHQADEGYATGSVRGAAGRRACAAGDGGRCRGRGHAPGGGAAREALRGVHPRHGLLPRLGGVPLATLRPEHLDDVYAELLREGRRERRPMSLATVQPFTAWLAGRCR